MNPRLIVIDGKTYTSVDEMPPDVRQQYEQALRSLKDQNGNRVPDAFEGANLLADQNRNGIPDSVEGTPGGNLVASSLKILMDGREFNSLDDLPPEARAKYEQAMSMIDADRNGMPDFLEGAARAQPGGASVVGSAGDASPSFSRPPLSVESPTITPDTTNGWMLALLVLAVLFVCAAGAAGVWYFFLR